MHKNKPTPNTIVEKEVHFTQQLLLVGCGALGSFSFMHLLKQQQQHLKHLAKHVPQQAHNKSTGKEKNIITAKANVTRRGNTIVPIASPIGGAFPLDTSTMYFLNPPQNFSIFTCSSLASLLDRYISLSFTPLSSQYFLTFGSLVIVYDPILV
jgi:hypothetical protein